MMRTLLITTSLSLSLSALALAVHTPQASVSDTKTTNVAAQKGGVNIKDVGDFKKEVANMRGQVAEELTAMNEGLEALDAEARLDAVEILKNRPPAGFLASLKKKFSKDTKAHAEAALHEETVKLIKSDRAQIKRMHLILGTHTHKMEAVNEQLKEWGDLKNAPQSVQEKAFHLLAKWVGLMKALESYAQKRLVGVHQGEVIKNIVGVHDKILTQYLDIVSGKVSVIDLTKSHQVEAEKLLEKQPAPLPAPAAEKQPSSPKNPSAEDEEWKKIMEAMGEKIRSESKPSSRRNSVSSVRSRSLKAQDTMDSVAHEDEQVMPRNRHHTDRSFNARSVAHFESEDEPHEKVRKHSEAQDDLSDAGSMGDSDVFDAPSREESWASEESVPVRAKLRQRSVTPQASIDDEDDARPKVRLSPQRAVSVNAQEVAEDLMGLMEVHRGMEHSFRRFEVFAEGHNIPHLQKGVHALKRIVDSKEGAGSIAPYVSELEKLDLPNEIKERLKAFEWQYNSYQDIFAQYCERYKSRGLFEVNTNRNAIRDRDLNVEVSLSQARHASSSSLQSEDSAVNRSQGNKSLDDSQGNRSLEDTFESGSDEELVEENEGVMRHSQKHLMAPGHDRSFFRGESLVDDAD